MATSARDPESPGYRTRVQAVSVGGIDLTIRSLFDLDQHSDPDGTARARGIDERTWSHFGHPWPAGLVLAGELAQRALSGVRMLEVGCGLAVASLVAHCRQADVTACDRHPLTETFLHENLRLNDLPSLAFRAVDWNDPDVTLGAFDLIAGSDLLYDHVDPAALVRFVVRHAAPGAEVLIADLGRRRLDRFTQAMAAFGFGCVERRVPHAPRTLLAHYRRTP